MTAKYKKLNFSFINDHLNVIDVVSLVNINYVVAQWLKLAQTIFDVWDPRQVFSTLEWLISSIAFNIWHANCTLLCFHQALFRVHIKSNLYGFMTNRHLKTCHIVVWNMCNFRQVDLFGRTALENSLDSRNTLFRHSRPSRTLLFTYTTSI